MHHTIVFALLAAFVAAGCSTTPPVVTEQANHGASLIGQLETAMAEYRRIERNAEEARQRSLQEQLAAIEAVKPSTNRDARARKSAGDRSTGEMVERLIGDADGIADDAAVLAAANKASAATLAALVTPLASTKAATTAAQKKLVEMGSELPASVRRAEFLSFAKAIKDSVEANKKKIADAEAVASKN